MNDVSPINMEKLWEDTSKAFAVKLDDDIMKALVRGIPVGKTTKTPKKRVSKYGSNVLFKNERWKITATFMRSKRTHLKIEYYKESILIKSTVTVVVPVDRRTKLYTESIIRASRTAITAVLKSER